jgi:hypothetical protein
MSAIIVTVDDQILGVVLLPDADDETVHVFPAESVCCCPAQPLHKVAGHMGSRPRQPAPTCSCGMNPPHRTNCHELIWRQNERRGT